jgi:hypothetical protein
MRIRTILAAAAAPAALAAALLGAAAPAAHAATTSAPAMITCGSTDPTGGGQVLGSDAIIKNLDVPAGKYCSLQWAHVTGNVTVEGVLTLSATTVNGNVTVSGGGPAGSGSQLWLVSYPSHIIGNLTVTGSAGGPNGNGDRNGTSFGDNASTDYQGGPVIGASQVDGNFSFTGNTGWLYVGSPLHVKGNFTASGNGPYTWSGAFDYSGVSAAKTSVVPPTYSS